MGERKKFSTARYRREEEVFVVPIGCLQDQEKFRKKAIALTDTRQRLRRGEEGLGGGWDGDAPPLSMGLFGTAGDAPK